MMSTMSSKKSGDMFLSDAQILIARVWLGGFVVLLLLLTLQAASGHYDDVMVIESFIWLLPNTFPTLFPIIGILSSSALKTSTLEVRIRRGFVRVVLYLSVFYFILLLVPLLAESRLIPSSLQRSKLLSLSNLWLAPMQGLITATLGAMLIAPLRRGQGSNSQEKNDNDQS